MDVSAEDAVIGQLVAYNARDVNNFIRYFASDVKIEDGAGNILLSTKDELYAKYETMFASYPQLHCVVVNSMRVGQYAIDEEIISGREETPIHCIVEYTINTANLIEKLRILK
ncbi:hypothetical protein B484DRAFT_431231 [Ochromonadaceae sp. CCMP2298]|nr:hypothetical protein B484DRAFT_431231 [Ochromonadaceae sp. CCMP2298]